jgi:DNA-binding transcriptional MerR regulator
MDKFTISEIVTLSGIKAHTIRIWEQRYSFLKPCRTHSNIRYYSCSEVKKILNIALLNRHGYKISKLESMPEHEIETIISQLDEEEIKQEKIIHELLQQMIDFNLNRFEKILDDCLAEIGMDKAVVQIILPFLERTGISGMDCHFSAVQQHLAAAIIRQKLMAALDNLKNELTKQKSILLFSPENQHDENNLLLIKYLLRSKGFPVIYLGPDVPLADAVSVASLKKTDIIILHISCSVTGMNLSKLSGYFKKHLQKFSLVFSGLSTALYKGTLPTGFHIKPSLTEVKQFISTS